MFSKQNDSQAVFSGWMVVSQTLVVAPWKGGWKKVWPCGGVTSWWAGGILTLNPRGWKTDRMLLVGFHGE